MTEDHESSPAPSLTRPLVIAFGFLFGGAGVGIASLAIGLRNGNTTSEILGWFLLAFCLSTILWGCTRRMILGHWGPRDSPAPPR